MSISNYESRGRELSSEVVRYSSELKNEQNK